MGRNSRRRDGTDAVDARAALNAQRAGRLDEADRLYREILVSVPDYAPALHALGLLAQRRGDEAAALDFLERAVASVNPVPAPPEYRCNLAAVLGRIGRPDNALSVLDRLLANSPDYADAHYNRAMALTALGRPVEAINAFRQAIASDPDHPRAHAHLARALLHKSGRAAAAEALDLARRAVELAPADYDAQIALGNALRLKTGAAEITQAVAAYRRAAALRPAAAEPHNNAGAALLELGRPADAIGALEVALKLHPESPEAHFNLALAHLRLGNFAQGWFEYEWRRQLPKDRPDHGRFPQPEWNGSDIAGRTLLLVAEQGMGDTLQFVRYAPALAARGATVCLECQPALAPLIRRCPAIAHVIARGEPPPRFDAWARLLSIPGILNTTTLSSIPATIPYVHPDPARLALWSHRMGALAGFKIGIVWQGNPEYAGDHFRSVPLAFFAHLARVPGVRLISLQRGPGSEQLAALRPHLPAFEPTPPLDADGAAFEDTAAVMKCLDLVVTSDTAAAHLAGALGVPVWLALSVAADWRWLLDRTDSPWYPTMRCFRQPTLGDWDTVFSRMAAELRPLVGAPPPVGPIAVPISPGELIDKITILQLKSERITDIAKLANVRAELAHLLRARDAAIAPQPTLDELARDLKSANEALWDVEDELRAHERAGNFDDEFVALARAVYHANDRRALLKREINDLLGSNMREEKVYEDYGFTDEPV